MCLCSTDQHYSSLYTSIKGCEKPACKIPILTEKGAGKRDCPVKPLCFEVVLTNLVLIQILHRHYKLGPAWGLSVSSLLPVCSEGWEQQFSELMPPSLCTFPACPLTWAGSLSGACSPCWLCPNTLRAQGWMVLWRFWIRLWRFWIRLWGFWMVFWGFRMMLWGSWMVLGKQWVWCGELCEVRVSEYGLPTLKAESRAWPLPTQMVVVLSRLWKTGTNLPAYYLTSCVAFQKQAFFFPRERVGQAFIL